MLESLRARKAARRARGATHSLALRSVKPPRRMFSPLRVKSDSSDEMFQDLERSAPRTGFPRCAEGRSCFSYLLFSYDAQVYALLPSIPDSILV